MKDNNLPATALETPNYMNGSLSPLNISIFNSSKPAVSGAGLLFDENGDYYYGVDAMWVQLSSEGESPSEIKVALMDYKWAIHDTETKAVFYGGRKDIPPDFAPSIAQNPQWNSALGGIFAFLAVLLITIGVTSVAIVFFYRTEGVIKKASWKSLTLIALGTSIASISPLLYIGTPNRAVCVLQPIVLNVGFGNGYRIVCRHHSRVLVC